MGIVSGLRTKKLELRARGQALLSSASHPASWTHSYSHSFYGLTVSRLTPAEGKEIRSFCAILQTFRGNWFSTWAVAKRGMCRHRSPYDMPLLLALATIRLNPTCDILLASVIPHQANIADCQKQQQFWNRIYFVIPLKGKNLWRLEVSGERKLLFSWARTKGSWSKRLMLAFPFRSGPSSCSLSRHQLRWFQSLQRTETQSQTGFNNTAMSYTTETCGPKVRRL